MQRDGQVHDGRDIEVVSPLPSGAIDHGVLRILAEWIAQRAGIDPEIGAPIDRDFVVAQAHG